MYNKVVGNNILIIGDLHFSDVYNGKHKNYLENCLWVMKKIVEKVTEEKPSAVVLLGDLIGWTETNIRDRQVLSAFIKTLTYIKDVCPVYAVQGNHDMKGYPDFLFLKELGIIITSDICDGYFDYYGDETQTVPEARFHLVDYGQENKELTLNKDGATNIVLAHNNFTINGVTTWYSANDGIELGMQQNFSGVKMVISGHIHNPSPELSTTQMPNQENCMLFYAGCPTRPVKDKEMYNSCWWVFFRYDKNTNTTNFMPEPFKLKPVEEIFYVDDNFIEDKTAEQLVEEIRKKNLKNVLEELLTYRIQEGDYLNQIDIIQNASDEAKELAKQYLSAELNKAKA